MSVLVWAGLRSVHASVSPFNITVAVGACWMRSGLEEPGHRAREALLELPSLSYPFAGRETRVAGKRAV